MNFRSASHRLFDRKYRNFPSLQQSSKNVGTTTLARLLLVNSVNSSANPEDNCSSRRSHPPNHVDEPAKNSYQGIFHFRGALRK